jgi:hypothetical protein
MQDYFDKLITGFAVFFGDNTLLYCPLCFMNQPTADDFDDENVVVLHPGGDTVQCNFCSRPVN